MGMENFMKMAIQAAVDNVSENHGGPFGAVVVKEGKIVGIGRNEVTSSNDPTAHAEIQAIRSACANLGTFQLEDCEIYSSCEPCPMCMGAIFWARPTAVYFASTKEDAAAAGFDDQFIYEQLALAAGERQIIMKQLFVQESQDPFQAWVSSLTKITY
ncbi:nucleoside deaminase [Peribacillus kribbensis]|uniref:nucleoside deaminase n=1 Tax=Peribacillus kribbensis TaxID=356658 RepID=UPI00047A08F3|nr:nucleoside deaminase [Peribacillus kribbensis]